jgi:NTE family protein
VNKFIVSILLLCCSVGFGQDYSSKDPKVGLVLSGGGAKGLAHIGVLKTLDSLNVRIDYIAGSSMGAVVGALYASGYSGKQLDSIFKSLDFNHILNDEIQRNSKTFYERKNAEKYVLTLPAKDFKLHLPSSISRGQNLFNLLTKLTLHVTNINDFEALPIPFFCVATDLVTGEEVLLNQGNLAHSIAASSALPTLFQPILIDNRLMMDGGIVNNYPIEHLKTKGLDVIIGVDVQGKPLKKDELATASNIILQISNFQGLKEMKEKRMQTDVYIKPEVEDYSILSFNNGEAIISKGIQSVADHHNILKTIAQHQNTPQRAQLNPSFNSIKINTLNLEGHDKYTYAYVMGKLRLKKNRALSFDDFSEGVNNLLATKNFDNFLYTFKASEADEFEVNATLKESTTQQFVKLGLHYDPLYKSAALINFTKKHLLHKNDVLSLDGILGDNSRFNFDYYVDKGFYWSIGLNTKFNSFEYLVNPKLLAEQFDFNGIDLTEVLLSDFSTQLFVETLIHKDLSLKLGLEYKILKLSTKDRALNGLFNSQRFIFEDNNLLSLVGALKIDTIDNWFFPTSGFVFEGLSQLFLSHSRNETNTPQFSFLKSNLAKAFSFGKNISFVIGTEGGFKLGNTNIESLDFGLGGYSHNHINNYSSFYGYDFYMLSGDSYVKAYGSVDYEFVPGHHFNFAANYANIDDDIFNTNQWLKLPTYSGYALGYGMETFLGPLEIKYSWSPETSQPRWFINLGYWF